MFRAALAPALAFSFSAAASAVLIDGEDGSRDVAPFEQPVLAHVGARGSLSAIYLGNGVVLTANHVGAGDVSFAGKSTAVAAIRASWGYRRVRIDSLRASDGLPVQSSALRAVGLTSR